MPRPKFAKGNPGRKKGAVNKTTRAAKEAFILAFEEAGSVAELVKWAKRNRTEFYKLYARLIPVDLTNNGKPFEAPVIALHAEAEQKAD